MKSRYKFIFTIGLVLIAIGAYGLLTQSTWSNVVNSLFTIFGIIMSFAQLFVTFPLFASTTSGSAGSTISIGTGAPAKSAVSGTTGMFRVSAITLFFCSIGFGIYGFLALSNPYQESLLAMLLFVVTNILLLCSLPGFHLRQVKTAGGLGSIGALIVAAASIINICLGTIYIINFNPGYPIPSSVSTLAHVNNYFLIAGNISLGTSMIYARVYPRWTGIAMLMTGCAGILLLLNPPPNVYTTIAGLWDILLAALYIQCSFILFS